MTTATATTITIATIAIAMITTGIIIMEDAVIPKQPLMER
jgi:hypothetical protein